MRTITKIFLIIAFLFAINSQQLFAQEMKSEKKLIFYLAVYDLDVSESINVYASHFDSDNYSQLNFNDEFERPKIKQYNEKIKSILMKKVNKINYGEKFTMTGYGELGEYSFTDKSFPINFIKSYNETFSLSSCGQIIIPNIDGSINKKDFSWSLNMSEERAKSFIKKRKNNQGTIDRIIYLRATYSIIDRKYPWDSGCYCYLNSYCYSIEIFDKDGATKLATLYPNPDYYDKINGVKMKEGNEVIYFKNDYYKNNKYRDNSIIVPQKEDADYYRVIDYSDGKIINVKDYYLTGKLKMEGSYDPYCAEKGFENGHFIYYYKNGFKEEEVDIVKGQKKGCDYKWNDDGTCSYTNCDCTNQKEKLQEKTKTSEKALKDFGNFSESRDERVYKTILIGTQTWMAENLNVNRFLNGDPIPEAKTNGEWVTAGRKKQSVWCYYNNDPENGKKYGKLYNWYAINDKRGLAPKGWHVATIKEYEKLTNMVDDANALKSIGQGEGDGAGNNMSGFSALLGGYREGNVGNFCELKNYAKLWSSTMNGNVESANYLYMSSEDSKINLTARYSEDGYSVRCVKD